jgi:death on curing protein
VEFLTAEDLVEVAALVLGAPAPVRDYGLLDAAAHRPRATLFGQDVYPTVHDRAAALLESICRNHALVDGNKRLAWAATAVFYGLNGYDLDQPSTQEAVELVVGVASEHPELAKVAERLAAWARPRGQAGR